MFKKFTNACKCCSEVFAGCIHLLYHPYYCSFLAALPVTGMKLWDVADAWGKGILESEIPLCRWLCNRIGTALCQCSVGKKSDKCGGAGVPKSPTSAIVFITVVSMIACWLNWVSDL